MDFLWFLSQFRNEVTNGIFQFFTMFGEQLLVIALVCVIFWCLDKNMAIRLGLSYFIAGLVVQMMKIVFCIPRPWVLDKNFKPVGSAIETATGYSFPSGHSQGAASLWGVLGIKAKKNIVKISCFLIALLTGFSRMFLGVHTPKDVAVGLCIGFFVAVFVCGKQTESFVKKYQPMVCLVFGILALALWGFAAYRISFAGVEVEEGLDCCKAAGAGFGFAVAWYLEERYVLWNPKTFFQNKNWKARVYVFVPGIIGTLILKVGLKVLLGAGIVESGVQYALLVLWIVVVYPIVVLWATKK